MTTLFQNSCAPQKLLPASNPDPKPCW